MATTLATWTIDPVDSSVEFSLDCMGLSARPDGGSQALLGTASTRTCAQDWKSSAHPYCVWRRRGAEAVNKNGPAGG